MPEAFSYESINIDFVLSLPSLSFGERSQMTRKAGVYIVYQVLPIKKILYVGKSDCLNARLNSNHNVNGFLSLLEHLGNELRIAYLTVESTSVDDLALNEIVIIHRLRPLLNVEHNPDKQIFTKNFQVEKFGYSVTGEVKERKREVKQKPPQTQPNNEISEIEAKSILSGINTMTIRELKLAAMKVGVTGYSYMTKDNLVASITSLLKKDGTPKTGEKPGLYAVN